MSHPGKSLGEHFRDADFRKAVATGAMKFVDGLPYWGERLHPWQDER
jgi:hypothetical protein